MTQIGHVDYVPKIDVDLNKKNANIMLKRWWISNDFVFANSIFYMNYKWLIIYIHQSNWSNYCQKYNWILVIINNNHSDLDLVVKSI